MTRLRVVVGFCAIFGMVSAVPMHAQSTTCIGDCGNAKVVTVGNVITCVNIDLGYTELSACNACSSNGMNVQISDLILAVNNVLLGCPGGPTPPPPPPTSTPTNTPSAPTPTATAASVVRVFTIDPGKGDLSHPTGPDASSSGFFSSALTGDNAATMVSSGPLTLVMGQPDANGVATLSLQDEVTVSVFVSADRSCVCLKFMTDGQKGQISCKGGGMFDTQADRPLGTVGNGWNTTTGLGSADTPPGSAYLQVNALLENVTGTCDVVNCPTHVYKDPPVQMAFTTTTATSKFETTGQPITLSESGQPFSCANFGTPGSGGWLATGAPANIVVPTANIIRFGELMPQ